MKHSIDSGLFHEQQQVSRPEVAFFFSAHGLPEDYKGMKEALNDADVVVLESHGWNEAELNLLREIASGSKIPKHMKEGRPVADILEYEEELLFNSGKRVEIVDVPEGHELADVDDGTGRYSDIAERYISQGDLSGALDQLRDAAKTNADYIQKKDQFIEAELNRLLEKLSKEGEQQKVLVQMGSTHTGIAHDLLRSKDASRVDNEILFDFTDELVRTYRFEKEPREDLVVKALAELLVKRLYFAELSKIPSVQRAKFFRSVFKNLTIEQLEELGGAMEQHWFQSVVTEGKEDSDELNQTIFNDAWDRVVGSDLDTLIQEALVESKQNM